MPQSLSGALRALLFLPVALAAQSTVSIDNARIGVLAALDAPHKATALHKHDLNRVMIYLDNADQDISHPDAPTEHLHWKMGDVAWSPAGGMHISENVGNTPLRIVEIEIKQPGPSAPPVRNRKLDPISIDPGHNKLIFENAQVRVYRSTNESGDRQKWHDHVGVGRAVVLLSPVAARIESASGSVAPMSGGLGDVFWTDGYIKHRGLNLGTRSADTIIVEVK